MPEKPRPLVLVVLDGWGMREPADDNAISLAQTPFYDSLLATYPNTTLETCGHAVGLPEGKAGNSETGHMNLGAGYIVEQDVVRISHAIDTKEFFQNPTLMNLKKHVTTHHSAWHILGLLSEANVHSEYKHLLALLDFAKQNDLKRVYLHLFTDGRDSPPSKGIEYVENLQNHLNEIGIGSIASIIGRYYAMDRDKRWDRTQQAYDLLTQAKGTIETDPISAIKNAYAKKETDEFIKPISITKDSQQSVTIQPNDAVLFFNFRTDRPRQLTEAFVKNDFDQFERNKKPANLFYATMTQYDAETPVTGILFPPLQIAHPFAQVLSEAGLTQLHLAETEKVAHVTYFFNGGREEPFAGEERIHIPSNRSVPTYDFAPEMKAQEITDAAIQAIETGKYDFILINYANADMVAHSGNLAATITAVETIDQQLQRLVPVILKQQGAVIITSDHGNAEIMFNSDRNEIDTEHNVSPAPFIYVAKDAQHTSLQTNGVLADVSVTMLQVLQLEKPSEMDRSNLLEKSQTTVNT